MIHEEFIAETRYKLQLPWEVHKDNAVANVIVLDELRFLIQLMNSMEAVNAASRNAGIVRSCAYKLLNEILNDMVQKFHVKN